MANDISPYILQASLNQLTKSMLEADQKRYLSKSKTGEKKAEMLFDFEKSIANIKSSIERVLQKPIKKDLLSEGAQTLALFANPLAAFGLSAFGIGRKSKLQAKHGIRQANLAKELINKLNPAYGKTFLRGEADKFKSETGADIAAILDRAKDFRSGIFEKALLGGAKSAIMSRMLGGAESAIGQGGGFFRPKPFQSLFDQYTKQI